METVLGAARRTSLPLRGCHSGTLADLQNRQKKLTPKDTLHTFVIVPTTVP